MSESLHLVCPNCQAVNRVPSTRLSQQPICGKCHQPIFSGTPMELTAATFHNHITNNDIPVLVDFWAPWCGPCRAIGPIVEELAVKFGDKIKFKKCNVDDNPLTPSKYGIKSIPTLIFFKGGKVFNQVVGVVAKSKLEDMINSVLA